jgi:hypothetical protein
MKTAEFAGTDLVPGAPAQPLGEALVDEGGPEWPEPKRA